MYKCKVCGCPIETTIEGEWICEECDAIRQIDDEDGRSWTAEELANRKRLRQALLGRFKQVAVIDGQPVMFASLT